MDQITKIKVLTLYYFYIRNFFKALIWSCQWRVSGKGKQTVASVFIISISFQSVMSFDSKIIPQHTLYKKIPPLC